MRNVLNKQRKSPSPQRPIVQRSQHDVHAATQQQRFDDDQWQWRSEWRSVIQSGVHLQLPGAFESVPRG